MKHKTAELEGELLDAAVLKCITDPVTGNYFINGSGEVHRDWASAGPIIESKQISIYPVLHGWAAERETPHDLIQGSGRVPLIAAMRCLVLSELGEEVEL